jgi:hypothetical protein
MKRYYTTTKTGESVEVPQDLAKQLVKMGKKKPEDFEIEEVPDEPTAPAAPTASVAPAPAAQAPQEPKTPSLLEATFPRSTSPEARADGGWMEPPRASLRFAGDVATLPGRALRALVGPQSEEEKQTAGAGNLFLRSLAQTELPEGTNIGNRLTYGMLMSPAAVATAPLKGGALPVAATMAAGNQAMNWAEGKPLSGTQFVTETALGTGIGKALQGVGSLAAAAPGAMQKLGVNLIASLTGLSGQAKKEFANVVPYLIEKGIIKPTNAATGAAIEPAILAAGEKIGAAAEKYKGIGAIDPDKVIGTTIKYFENRIKTGEFDESDAAIADRLLRGQIPGRNTFEGPTQTKWERWQSADVAQAPGRAQAQIGTSQQAPAGLLGGPGDIVPTETIYEKLFPGLRGPNPKQIGMDPAQAVALNQPRTSWGPTGPIPAEETGATYTVGTDVPGKPMWDAPTAYNVQKRFIGKTGAYGNRNEFAETDLPMAKQSARELRNNITKAIADVAPDLRKAVAESAPLYAGEEGIAKIGAKATGIKDLSGIVAGTGAAITGHPLIAAGSIATLAANRPALGLALFKIGEMTGATPVQTARFLARQAKGKVSTYLEKVADRMEEMAPVGSAPVTATFGAGLQSLAKFAPRAIPSAIDQTSSRRKAP